MQLVHLVQEALGCIVNEVYRLGYAAAVSGRRSRKCTHNALTQYTKLPLVSPPHVQAPLPPRLKDHLPVNKKYIRS